MSKKSTEEKGKKAVKSAKNVEPEKLVTAPEVKEAVVTASEPKKKKKASSPKKETSKKETSKKAPAKKAAAKPVSRKKVVRPTNDDIALRAYFIAERRQALGLPGDSTGDWVEAERQLLQEAGLKK